MYLKPHFWVACQPTTMSTPKNYGPQHKQIAPPPSQNDNYLTFLNYELECCFYIWLSDFLFQFQWQLQLL